MLRPRIIPCLLVHNKGLVKTVGFSAAKYVGDPINVVKIFNEKTVDELIILDIDATVRGCEPDYTMIENVAIESRMPLCYGGGVKNPEQAKRIIGLGVEKVAISSAAIENPQIISAIADAVGTQSVVVVLDVRAKRDGSYEILTHNAKVSSGRNANEVAMQAEKCGAGEIVINSIDNDGRMQGYDLEMIQALRKTINIPMTVLGGAGSLSDISAVLQRFGVMGVAAGSLFVFKGVYKAVLVNYPNVKEHEALWNACSVIN